MATVRLKKGFYKKPIKNGAGFTLIEVVVYLGLFAIMFGGAVAVAYNVIESSGRNQTRSNLQEEGNFIIAKINWALSGAQYITSPNVGTSSSVLSVTKYDASAISINLNAQIMQLINSSGTYALNNSGVQVQIIPSPSLVFTYSSASGDGINPEKVDASFTLTSKTPNGQSLTQDFFTTVYLRK